MAELSRCNLEYVCRRQKFIDPNKKEHVLAQLRSEGHKRIESFLFERLFNRIVLLQFSECDFSLGWTIQFDDNKLPRYWFKLCDSFASWNKADELVSKFLTKHGRIVVRVSYQPEDKEFSAQLRQGNEWLPEQRLSNLFQNLTGTSAPRTTIHNVTSIDVGRQESAIRMIGETFTPTDLCRLSLNRIFINCHLAPWFNRPHMDLDASFTVGGQVRFVEFKQKYPTGKGLFGIDKIPHGVLIDWLESVASPLLHVICSNPVWRKEVSPLHLLRSESVTARHAIWLGTVLVATVFSKQSLTTRAGDSGMYQGDRSQRGINAESFQLLGSGLQPSDLCGFLRGHTKASQADAAILRDARNRATRSFGGLNEC